jgi:hypothetical protein
VKATGARPKIIVSADGRGVVNHAGARLLADVAEATGLTSACSDAFASLRQRRGRHDPGRVAVDLAVMLADGGEAIADRAVLRDQTALFGPVASDVTAWRLLSDMDSAVLGRLRDARAQARELAWSQLAETRGGLPPVIAAGQPVPGLVLDMDASIVICHSERKRRPRLGRSPSATTRCSASWTTPARRCPGCCAKDGPGRTPPPTTFACSTTPSPKSLTPTGMARRF